MTPMPTHLQRHLLIEGVLSETGLTKKARYRHCPRGCGLLLLAAIDLNGCDAWTWPWPTTPWGEYVAKTAGLHTWHRAVAGEGLVYRSAQTITAKPAHTVSVHVQHRCADPPPEIRKMPAKKRPTTNSDDPPPF